MSKLYLSKNQKKEQFLKAVFEEFYQRLCFYATRQLGDSEEARDIVQEVLLDLWEHQLVFKDSCALSGWLYTAVYHACMNRLRLTGIHTKHHRRILQQAEPWDTNNYMTSRIEHEVLFEIFTAINQLPEECRKIFKMSYIEGYTLEEVAHKLEISVHTVKSQRARAKKLLQQRLKGLFSFVVALFFC